MSAKVIEVHPDNPQSQRIVKVAKAVKDGAVIVYPTDSSYALGCRIGDKEALNRIKQIRGLKDGHNFTLACRSLKELSAYARVDDKAFRTLKKYTPGAYTFILNATKDVPNRLLHPKKKTIGLRIPDHAVTLALLEHIDEPVMTTSLILPDEKWPLGDPDEIRERTHKLVDYILLDGWGGTIPTTMIDMTGGSPTLIREGLGESASF